MLSKLNHNKFFLFNILIFLFVLFVILKNGIFSLIICCFYTTANDSKNLDYFINSSNFNEKSISVSKEQDSLFDSTSSLFFNKNPGYKTPETLMPGFYFPLVEEIDRDKITFLWNRVSGAEEYLITIYNINILDSKQITQEVFTEFRSKDTFCVFDRTFFDENGTFKWLLRARIDSIITSPSRSRFFKFSTLQDEELIRLISPGFDASNEINVSQPNPTITWFTVKTAKEYFLTLFEIDSVNQSKLVFDSRDKFKIPETNFTLPPDIIRENTKYRLTLYGIGEDKKIFKSQDYFIFYKPLKNEFLVNKTNISELEEVEELVLQLQYGNVVNQYITGLYKEDKVYLPILSLLNHLEISARFDERKKILELSLPSDIGQKNLVDLENKLLEINSAKSNLREDEFLVQNGDIFLIPYLIEKLINVKINVDLSFLNVKVFSDVDLPVLRTSQLERKLATFQKQTDEKIDYPMFGIERNVLNGYVFDYYFQSIKNKNLSPMYIGELHLGGEILGGDFTIKRIFNLTSDRHESLNDFRWRYVFNNNYLNQILVGDIAEETNQIYFIRGLKISNEPVAPRRILGTYKYKGTFEPYGIIELYINNTLYSITRANEIGNFVFELPLYFGSSFFELKYYGKQGSTFTKKDVLQVPYYFLPVNELNYNFSLGKIKNTNKRIFLGEIGYGITDWLTNRVGFEFFPDTLKRPNVFNSIYARILTNYVFNFEYSSLFRTKLSISSIFSSYTGFNLHYYKYVQNEFFNPVQLKEEYGMEFNVPISIKSKVLNFFVSNVRRNFVNTKIFDRRGYIYYNSGLINPFLGINEQLIKSVSSNNYFGQLFFGASINLPKLTKSNNYFTGNVMNFKLIHNYSENQFESVNLYYSTNLIGSLRFQAWAERNFLRNYSNYNIQLILELPQFRYWFSSNLQNNITQSIHGSINYYPKINRLYFHKQPQIDKSSLIVLMYEDQNKNNRFDSEDKLVKGTDLKARIPYTRIELRDGIYLIPDLVPYDKYTFKLEESQKGDLLKKPEIETFEVFTEPNQGKYVSIPFYSAGEVSGTVFRNINDKRIPVSGIKLKIVNLNTGKQLNIQTFSDGTFYYFGLPPAKYSIEILEEQLKSLELISDPEKIYFEITKVETLNYVEDLTFVLY